MGMLDDLAMGLGLMERTEDYDARTADTIAASRVAADRGDATNAMYLAQARNPDHSTYFGNYEPAMQARNDYLFDVGGSTYNPQVAERQEGNNVFQNLLYSAPMSEDNPVSPRRVAIGPFNLDEPLSIPTPLSLMTKILGGLQRPTGGDDPLTSTAFDKYEDDSLTDTFMLSPDADFLEDWDLVKMAQRRNRGLDTGGVY